MYGHMPKHQWIRVEAQHYVACFGVDLETGKVIDAAPILHWTIGKTKREVMDYFKRKGFRTQTMRD